jgi:hypothetical protein
MSLFVGVIIAAVMLSTGNDGQSHEAIEAGQGDTAANITLTLVNTFPAEGRALGLYMIEETALLGVNNLNRKIYGYSPISGTVTVTIDLDPANTSCFGVAFNPNSPGTEYFHTNDWGGNDLFYTMNWGSSWNNVFDPSFDKGRGMDFDGVYHWTTNGQSSIIRFIPEYTPFDVLSVPETSGQLSGITVFPWEGHLGVAVTSYGADGIWFYLWNGVVLDYLGFGQFPITPNDSYGLAHSEDLNCLFWSYKDSSGDYMISRLAFEINQELSPSTWGAIKAGFPPDQNEDGGSPSSHSATADSPLPR